MAVKPIPEGYMSITPYLTVDDGKAAIEFYKRAFGATPNAHSLRLSSSDAPRRRRPTPRRSPGVPGSRGGGRW